MKKILIHDQPPEYDAHFWELTRDDLEESELEIFDKTLPRLASPGPDQLHMLAAYAWAASELKKAAEGDDPDLTLWLRDCMVYARNGLGIAPLRFIDGMDVLLRYDEKSGWPPVYLALSVSWQLPESTRSR